MEESLYDVHAAMEDRHWWFVARRNILNEVTSILSQDFPRPFIVDVGCGTGASIAHFMENGFQCLGIDQSRSAIDYAEAKFPAGQYRCGNMPDDLRDIAADATLFTLLDVLEHVEDDRAFLADLVSLAPTGANILITVPALKRLWSPHDVANHHHRRYEKEQLQGTWNGLPVQCRMTGFFNARLYPVITLVRYFANLRNAAVGEGGSDFAMPAGPVNRLLTAIFAGECNNLVGQIDHPHAAAYRVGTSLMAVLRKE